MAKIKKRLTISEEFEIMKLVLDKFLWLWVIVMTFWMYTMFTKTFAEGLVWLIVGAVILILFMIIIVREYEIIK